MVFVESIPSVRVNQKAAGRIASGHPWIFASDVVSNGLAKPGDAVRVVDTKGKNLGIAHYSSTSQIALRLLSSRVESIDQKFLRARIADAIAYRQRYVTGTDAFRVVHAEADFLPGLIVDRYADWLSIQLLNQGMDRQRTDIVEALAELLNPKGIVARNDVAVRAKEDLPQKIEVLAGEIPDVIETRVNGYTMFADLIKGQKTGVFLDQRENYAAVSKYGRGSALDCFAGSGGFALHLSKVCESVETVDSSGSSLDLLRANLAKNDVENVSTRQADILEYLPSLVSGRRSYNLVVIDPPAFTKSRSALEGAARGYKEINLRALRLLQPGGILVSCSCSHHMSEGHLLEVIAAAALDCGKKLRILERRTQSADHPILLTVPETHYLKCLILEVI
jgi:23S rRNA (cytosine1962-C5)-methyltransferase